MSSHHFIALKGFFKGEMLAPHFTALRSGLEFSVLTFELYEA